MISDSIVEFIKSVVTLSLLSLINLEILESNLSSLIVDIPFLINFIFSGFLSTPIILKPFSAKNTAVGRPTYPNPTIHIFSPLDFL